jgi:hypothetical protein
LKQLPLNNYPTGRKISKSEMQSGMHKSRIHFVLTNIIMKKMKKISIIILLLITGLQVSAKEGMWLPYLLEKLNADEMQAMGMRITADEIYSMQHSSLKDAIVHFGGGCTAELVSSKGLLLTNHHCGYRSIQKHSTVDHDYLTDGFWAKNMNEELQNPGLTAKIMTNMADVSEAVLEGVNDQMTQEQRQSVIAANIAKLKKEYQEDKFHQVQVKAFYYGNQYILMTYDIFYDVRLVGAPPSNIGKFGGDTDNWMWPRHTGDFSVFRIYANNDNQPADYNSDNKPYEPRQHLKISLKGVQEGDFTFVFGYPGTTQEYLPSYAIEEITQTINPFRIKFRREKLDIMKAAMDRDPAVRIQYSAKYASTANGWKKWLGENLGIERSGAIAIKKQEEEGFVKWLGSFTEGNELNIIDQFRELYAAKTDWEMGFYYFLETAYYHDLSHYVSNYFELVTLSMEEQPDTVKINKMTRRLKDGIDGFFKDYKRSVDKELFSASVAAYLDFPYKVPKPEILKLVNENYKGEPENYARFVYSKTMFNDPLALKKFLEDYDVTNVKKILEDPMYQYVSSVYSNYRDQIYPQLMAYGNQTDSLQRIYMKLIMEHRKGERIYPDANSTLRVAYGRVEGYEPRDGVRYRYYTTLSGIMDKEDPNIYDYVVEPKLKELYEAKDYERYGDKDGTMHVCFLASNHTTGGNSGSPVLNADGHLVGINFDRNWEGTMSDLMYDVNICRNISLDIRYCLFIIDKFADAHWLVEEMEIVE